MPEWTKEERERAADDFSGEMMRTENRVTTTVLVCGDRVTILEAAHNLQCRFNAARAEIASLRSQLAGTAWISVKQQMPPEKQIVLGFFELWGWAITSWFQWETMERPLWGPGLREWGDCTHWMPLPLAPSEPLIPQTSEVDRETRN